MKPYFIILIFLFLASCAVKEKTIVDFENKLSAIDKPIIQKKELSTVLIVPGAGCSGCVSNTENFIKKNISQLEQTLIIFTAIPSEKMLRMKLGIELETENIYLDLDDVFNSGKMYSFYPSIFYMQSGKVESFQYVDPENKNVLNTLIDDTPK